MTPLFDLSTCWFLTGPTASGKTAVALALAERIGAEIISLDSMAVFRRLDIGTAKPSPAEQARVRHHLVDVAEPEDEFSVAEYLEASVRAEGEIRARGKQVLFAGGTPLYLKALLYGLFDGPPADWELRRALEAEAAESPPGHLHAKLAAVDALAAERLHPNDTRRLVRALEVFLKTGRPISAWQSQFAASHPRESVRVFQLDWPRDVLHARIDARVEAMFAAGWIEEVRGLQAEGRRLGRTASQAVGYQEILAHLAGELDRPTTIERVQFRTHQFARRQCTWFQRLPECRRLALFEPFEADAVAADIERQGCTIAPARDV